MLALLTSSRFIWNEREIYLRNGKWEITTRHLAQPSPRECPRLAILCSQARFWLCEAQCSSLCFTYAHRSLATRVSSLLVSTVHWQSLHSAKVTVSYRKNGIMFNFNFTNFLTYLIKLDQHLCVLYKYSITALVFPWFWRCSVIQITILPRLVTCKYLLIRSSSLGFLKGRLNYIIVFWCTHIVNILSYYPPLTLLYKTFLFSNLKAFKFIHLVLYCTDNLFYYMEMRKESNVIFLIKKPRIVVATSFPIHPQSFSSFEAVI